MTDQQSPQAVECSRSLFEAWIEKERGDLTTFGRGANMHYLNSGVNHAWFGWQAGRQEQALQYLSDNGQWIEEAARLKAGWGACEETLKGVLAELATLKARALDVDAVMALADAYTAEAAAVVELRFMGREWVPRSHLRDAARAALLAKLGGQEP